MDGSVEGGLGRVASDLWPQWTRRRHRLSTRGVMVSSSSSGSNGRRWYQQHQDDDGSGGRVQCGTRRRPGAGAESRYGDDGEGDSRRIAWGPMPRRRSTTPAICNHGVQGVASPAAGLLGNRRLDLCMAPRLHGSMAPRPLVWSAAIHALSMLVAGRRWASLVVW
jgi:hypothetical protein